MKAYRKTLTIGGRRYTVSGTDPSKTEAKRRAEKIRKRGRFARVKRAVRKGRVIYLIMEGPRKEYYTAKGKRKR
jgi:hypothetical protein